MFDRDDSSVEGVPAETMAKDLAAKAGKLVGVSAAFVYCCYKEWRMGQEERAIEAKEKGEQEVSNQVFFFTRRAWIIRAKIFVA